MRHVPFLSNRSWVLTRGESQPFGNPDNGWERLVDDASSSELEDRRFAQDELLVEALAAGQTYGEAGALAESQAEQWLGG
jgi:hypothetical protein